MKIYTSFVSKANLETFISMNYLPVFIIRKIDNSKLIGKYSNTAIHFRDLSPSNELYQRHRDGKITTEEYLKQYTIELSSVNFQDIVDKLTILFEVSGANGIVLMGYGEEYKNSYRETLSDILNCSGLLDEKIEEYA